MKTVTFPTMGHYTEAFKYFAEELGFKPVVPPPTSQTTIKKGVRHSSDMVCYPFKTTLGNLIEGLDKGANNIIAVGTKHNDKAESCRFQYYYYVQEQILRKLGYEFNMIYLVPSLQGIKNISKITGKNYYIVLRALWRFYKKCLEIEEKHFTYSPKKINIGLVGEVYTLWEHSVNYNIINKLRKMGIGVHMSVTLSWFLKHMLHLADEKKYLYKEAKKYFPKRIGGHGWESVVNSIHYAKNGFDGIIHLLPLSCMPETMTEMSMNFVSDDYNIPIYRFPIDENNFEAGFDTRLETFIKIMKRNKS